MSDETVNAGGFITAGVNLTFSYAAGDAASRFLIALRDEQKIYGSRCPACRRVLVPARSFCPRCFVDTPEWLEVGPAGTLIAVTAVSSPLGLIRLDGADTNLVHRLSSADLRRGRRVEPVFAETRGGSILDIIHFRPLEETHADSI